MLYCTVSLKRHNLLVSYHNPHVDIVVGAPVEELDGREGRSHHRQGQHQQDKQQLITN
jgi:hypothetical protein